MSSTADVQDAWIENVWSDTDITDFTDKILQYEVTADSEAEKALIASDGGINFVEVVTSRVPTERELGNSTEALIRFYVEIRYTREKLVPGKTIDGDAYTQTQLFFETLYSLVNTFGPSWGSTVDYWIFGDYPGIASEDIGDIPCWRGVCRFQAFQYTTI